METNLVWEKLSFCMVHWR